MFSKRGAGHGENKKRVFESGTDLFGDFLKPEEQRYKLLMRT